MRRNTIYLSLSLALATALPLDMQAQNAHLEWVRGGGATMWDEASSVTTDPQGNAITVGAFYSDATPSTQFSFIPANAHTPLAGRDLWNAYAIKTNPAGDVIWAKNFFGGGGNGTASSVKTDKDGNIYITGLFNEELDFGTVQITSKGERDIYVVKLDSNGNYIWAHGFGGDDKTDEWGVGIDVDAAGNVYVTGQLTKGDVDMNPGAGVDLVSGPGLFFLKLSPAGDFEWANAINGDVFLKEFSGDVLKVNENGDVHVTGYFINTVDFDPAGSGQTLTSIPMVPPGSFPDEDAFVLKLDNAGNYRWARSIGGGGYTQGWGITVDDESNVYSVGTFANQIDLNPGAGSHVVNSFNSNHDVYISKLDSNGNYVWGKSFGGNGTEYGHGIEIDQLKNVYVTGSAGSTRLDYNPGTNPQDTFFADRIGSWADMFIVKLNEAGDFAWAKTFGSTSSTIGGLSLAISDKFEIYTIGVFNGTVDFDPGAGVENMSFLGGNSSIFIHKMSCSDRVDTFIRSESCGAYSFGDSIYTSTGTYIITSLTGLGCDSIITLDLTVNSITAPMINVDEFTLSVNDIYSKYQWFKDGDSIPGATASSYYVTENAVYYVAIENDEGCRTQSGEYRVNNVSVGEIAGGQGSITVYPNPVKDHLYIRTNEDVHVRLFQPDGRLVLQSESVHAAGYLSLNGLPAGIYILQVADAEGVLLQTLRLVKQ